MFTSASRQGRWEPSEFLSGKVAGWMCGLTLPVSKEKLLLDRFTYLFRVWLRTKATVMHSWLNFNVFFVAVNVVCAWPGHSSKTSIVTARPFEGTKNRCKVVYMV